MTRVPTNDFLAAKARELASSAPPGSREQRTWKAVHAALDSTGTVESARAFLLTLTIPTLRADAQKYLYKLTKEMAQ